MNSDDNEVRIIKRNPQAGDVVRSYSGRFYRVEQVYRSPGGGRVEFYGVSSLDDGLPNTFGPAEVETVGSADARRLIERGEGLT